MRTVLRWTARVLLGLLALIVALLVVLAVLMRTEGGRDFVRVQTQDILDGVLVGEARIGEIEALSLLPTHVRVRDVVVTDARGREAIRAELADVTLSPWPLLEGRVQVDSAYVRHPRVILATEEDGSLNLANLVPTSTPTPDDPDAEPWTIAVASASVARGWVEYRTPTSSRAVDRISLGGSLVFRDLASLAGAVDLDVRGPYTEAGRDTPFRLTVKGEVAKRKVDAAVALRGMGSKLDAIVRGKTSSASLTLEDARVVLDSKDVGPLALGMAPIGGALTATITARGPIDRLDGTVEVRARDYHVANLVGQALHVKAVLRDLPERAAGEVTVNATKLKLDTVPLGDLQVEALATEAGRKFEGHVTLKGGRWVKDLDTQLRATREDGDLWVFVPSLVAETQTARWRIDDARARLTAQGDIEVHRLVLQSKRGMISIDAELDEDLLDGPGFVKARIEGLHLASLRRDFAPGLPRISGLLEADVDLRLGPAPKAEVKVALDELSYPQLAGTVRTRAEVTLDRGLVTASVAVTGADLGRVRLDAQLDAPKQPFDPAGWGSFDGKRVRALSARVDRLLLGRLEPIVPLGFLGGAVDVTVNATPRLETLDVEIRARDVRHRELPGPLTLNATTKVDGKSTVLTAALGVADQPLAAVMARVEAGVRSWLRNPTQVIEREDAQVEVALDGFPVALMEDFKPSPPGVTVGRRKPVLSGEVTLHADVARKSGKYKADVKASGHQLAWVEKMPKITATASVALDGTKIDLSGELYGPLLGVLTLSGKGRAPADPTDGKAWQRLGAKALEALSLETKALDLGILDQMSDRRLALKGVVTSRIQASEGLGEVDASIKVTRFGRRNSRVTSDVQVSVSAGAKRSTLDLGVFDKGRLVVSATASAPLGVGQLVNGKVDFEALPLSARVRLDRVPLATVAEVAELGVPMSGSVTGTVAVDGTLADYRGKAFIDASQAVVKGQSFQRFVVDAALDPRRLTARVQAREKKTNGTLELGAAVDLAGGSKLDATLKAVRFRLDFLSAFFQRQRSIGGIAGVLDADVRFQGTPDDPSGKGKLRIQDLAIVLASPIPPLDKTTVEATFDGQKVAVDVKAHSGDGDLNAKVDATLRTLTTPKFEVQIETDDLPFVAGPRQALVDADVKVTGSVGEVMNIDVSIEEAKVEIPNASGTALKPIRDLADVVYVDEARRDSVMGAMTATAAPSTPIVVNINSKKAIPVRGAEIAALARIGLKLDGTSGVMEMAGRVMVGEGWLTLFGKRWDIQQAEIIMLGREEPRLQVEITRDLGSAVAIVRVRGSVSKPELQLLSDPPIFDEAQVLTFVLGAEPGSGDEDVSLEGRAAGAAVGALVGALQSKLEDKLPIDTINVDVEEGAKISRLSVGKWITGRIFVGYEYAFDAEVDENTNEGIVQVRLGSGWVLESRYGDRGEGGLDFIWVRRF